MMPICPDLPGLVGLSAAAACCYGPVSFARSKRKERCTLADARSDLPSLGCSDGCTIN
jgi:hypothetical protein